jgi:hypothetical protein
VKPPTPDFQSQQFYHKSVNVGIDADSVWLMYNNRGAGIKFCDVEYLFDSLHADLPHVTILGNAPVDPFSDGGGQHHGTAVMGEIISINNGWGTTGGAADCEAYFGGAYTAGDVFDPAAPIINALTVLHAGDVILLEQQIDGPNYDSVHTETQRGLVPIEWYKPSYDAIKLAVGQGITVVEAAGNGGENLDAPEYSLGNEGHYPFLPGNGSGAIIVGAGGAGGAYNGRDSARARMFYSNYGTRLDLQGIGESITTCGYGELYSDEGEHKWFVSQFGGTSSASPIVTNAVILLQSVYKSQRNGAVLTPAQVLSLLKQTGKPQLAGINPVSQHIGPLPNAYAAIKLALSTNTSINELAENSKPTIYPNPGKGKFTLHLAGTSGSTVQVCSTGGSVLKQNTVPSNVADIALDLSDQPDGVYFVRVVNAKGSSVNRVVVTH